MKALSKSFQCFTAALDTAELNLVLSDEYDNCIYVSPSVRKLVEPNSKNLSHTNILNAIDKAGLTTSVKQGIDSKTKSILAQGDAQRRLDEECNRYKKQIHWLTSILDAITSPLSVTNKNMEWTFVNKVVEDMLGVKRQDIVGKKCNNWGANICNTDDCGITCLRRGKDMGFVEVVQDVTKLNSYTNSLKKLMNDVHNSSDQVALGAQQISESSNTLAEGTVKQAGSIEELNSGIDLITTQTQTNATSAATASQLFDKSKENAIRGHQEMQVMLSSMNGIKEASNNISKIIKTIEDIAFQTNLLALNASVEAARAGEHGKGFAVVAEEVRTLAGRSQVAAKETDELIVESINRVGQGTTVAQSTAHYFDTIVSDFEQVSKIINEINISSAEQAGSIRQIGQGIHEIAQVVQTNSAMSQEVASASQELSNQAEILRSLVVDF